MCHGRERWWPAGEPDRVITANEVTALLHDRLRLERYETVFASDSGRSLHVVANGERALVMLLSGVDDPGRHAVDPKARGTSGGYLLANGQVDEYDDRDTVTWNDALDLVACVLDARPSSAVTWQAD